jgi:hypothetical protein
MAPQRKNDGSHSSSFVCSLTVVVLMTAFPAIARAADPEPGEAAGAARPTPPPSDVVAPTGAAEAASTPVTLPPAPPPPPPEKPVFDPKIGVGAWMRLGYRFENAAQPDKINDVFMDQIYLIAAFRGQFTPWLKWQASLVGLQQAQQGSVTLDAELLVASVAIQDLIMKVEPHESFNLWFGKMLLPVDRANLSGPWFINFWTMRGSFVRPVAVIPPPYGIKTGPFGRQQGVTAWGQFGGGRLKYFAGAYELDQQSTDAHPMYAGRLVGNLLDPEPGYYNQSAYHGEKDIVSVGVGAQYQKGGSVLVIPAADPAHEVGDLKVFTADLLIDKKLGDHVVTLEGGYYHTDDFQPVHRLYVGSLGYTSPLVGVGRISPAVRVQRATVPPPFSTDPAAGLNGIREVGLDREFWQVDGYVQYLIKSHFAKVMAGGFWTRTRLRSPAVPPNPAYTDAKGIQIGLQLIAL